MPKQIPNNGIRRSSTSSGELRPWRRRSPGRPGRWTGTPRPRRAPRCRSMVAVAGSTCVRDAARGEHPRGVRLDAQVQGGHGEALLAVRRHDVAGAAVVTSPVRSAPAIGGWAPHLRDQLAPWSRRRGGRRRRSRSASPRRCAAAGSARGCRRRRCRRRPAGPSLAAARWSPASSTAAATDRGPRSRPPRSGPTRRRPVVARRPAPVGDPAGVADLRRGGDHHLPAVGRVGQGLLVAGHPGGEHRLAERGPGGAEARRRGKSGRPPAPAPPAAMPSRVRSEPCSAHDSLAESSCRHRSFRAS